MAHIYSITFKSDKTDRFNIALIHTKINNPTNYTQLSISSTEYPLFNLTYTSVHSKSQANPILVILFKVIEMSAEAM